MRLFFVKPYTIPRVFTLSLLALISFTSYIPQINAGCRSSCSRRSCPRSCCRPCCGPTFSPWFGAGFYPGYYPATPWGPPWGFCGYPYPYYPGSTFTFGFSLGL